MAPVIAISVFVPSSVCSNIKSNDIKYKRYLSVFFKSSCKVSAFFSLIPYFNFFCFSKKLSITTLSTLIRILVSTNMIIIFIAARTNLKGP